MHPSRAQRFRSPGLVAGLLLSLGLGLGCSISPVVSVPDSPTGHYADCERASKRYCQNVLGATGEELEACSIERTFQCVSRVGT